MKQICLKLTINRKVVNWLNLWHLVTTIDKNIQKVPSILNILNIFKTFIVDFKSSKYTLAD